MQSIRDLFFGLLLPWNALGKILKHPKLLVLSVLPLGLTVLVTFLGLSSLKGLLAGYGMKLLAQWGWAAGSLTAQAALLVMDLALILVGAMSFSVVAAVLTAPFNDFLAEATEPIAGVPEVSAEFRTWGFRVRAVVIDIFKTLIIGVIQIFLLLGGLLAIWIPGLNLLFATLAFALLAYQYLMYPQTRRGIGFVESLNFIRRNLLATLGFGASIGFIFAIPVISALALPLAVVGGTLLFARDLTKEEGPGRQSLPLH